MYREAWRVTDYMSQRVIHTECLSKQGSKRHEFLSNKNGSNEKYKKLLINIKTQAFFILK